MLYARCASAVQVVPMNTLESARRVLRRAPFEVLPCSSWCYGKYVEPGLSALCPPALANIVRDCCEILPSKRPSISAVRSRFVAELAGHAFAGSCVGASIRHQL
mmetsp:Transcript_46838/g.99944  ORF Transcript_46838/g.99944 Transcript_46838/m.99944 type:complete len:104 (-) Transcript_46838:417-728(-)|eukprot:CAMPEP_0183338240 /NCGR_PEP_ID=MMETSP0164_2-20130417/5606_1 /TAXON_ID=221442 /ORGANISM="Coccolithus pelagicus ssp braarudi, Strain PLY182g" /LENGTH=103 /DNA_ID=CAMNT_0025508059 /DNA_START=415 /DNA_END=729 /DNA_ORIENTATION=+